MADGYISYVAFYYADEYIKHIKNTLGAKIWDDKMDEYKREGKFLKPNGKKHMIKSKCKVIICQITTQ